MFNAFLIILWCFIQTYTLMNFQTLRIGILSGMCVAGFIAIAIIIFVSKQYQLPTFPHGLTYIYSICCTIYTLTLAVIPSIILKT